MSQQHLSHVRGPEFLRRAFASEQACLVAKLRSSDRVVHPGDRGEVNEQYFIDVLRHYLPNRYTVEKAHVIDSRGQVSDSIDVVVYDRQYTPALLDSDRHRYVPAEAVYAVFECKPSINREYLQYSADKAASVRCLTRTSMPIPHAGGVYERKQPFEIVAGILAIDVHWTDGFGKSFQSACEGLTGDRKLHCGLAAVGYSFDVFDGSDTYNFHRGDTSLAHFLFRLLAKLQSLGTALAIDWNAYAAQLAAAAP